MPPERDVALLALVQKWEQRARRAFESATQEKTAFGRRFIEHGAMCYFNCAQDLRAAVQADSSPRPSATPTAR